MSRDFFSSTYPIMEYGMFGDEGLDFFATLANEKHADHAKWLSIIQLLYYRKGVGQTSEASLI